MKDMKADSQVDGIVIVRQMEKEKSERQKHFKRNFQSTYFK